MVNGLIGEVVLYLKSLQSNRIPMLPNGGISLTSSVMEKNIFIEMFYQNKFIVVSEIKKKILNTICTRICINILQGGFNKHITLSSKPASYCSWFS